MLVQLFQGETTDADPAKAALHAKICAVALLQADALVEDGERRAQSLEARARERLRHNRTRSVEEVEAVVMTARLEAEAAAAALEAEITALSTSPSNSSCCTHSTSYSSLSNEEQAAVDTSSSSSSSSGGGAGDCMPGEACVDEETRRRQAIAAAEARRRKALQDAQAAWDALRQHIVVPDAVVVKEVISQFTKIIARNNGRAIKATPADFVVPQVPVRGATGREAYLKA